jgi:hypothetical protein
MASRRLPLFFALSAALLLPGCALPEAPCRIVLEDASVVAKYGTPLDEEALHRALRESGWTDVGSDESGAVRATYELPAGKTLTAVATPTSEGMRLEVKSPVPVPTDEAAEGLLSPFVEPVFVELEPVAGPPADVTYHGGHCA